MTYKLERSRSNDGYVQVSFTPGIYNVGVALDILLVEDDDLVRDCLFEALYEAGFKIEGSGSGEAALAVLKAMLLKVGHPPSVVVTDINLGAGMDGLAFARAAREVWPALPVIYISGRYGELTGLRANERFLAKPFSTIALLHAIEAVRRRPSASGEAA